MTNNSISVSLAGGQVGCRRNTSLPRTFSINSTLISPSLNLPTKARPSGVCRLRAISCANAGFALPANKASVSPVVLTDHLGSHVGWGGRIRTSEWRDQNPLPYHLATPQHFQAQSSRNV